MKSHGQGAATHAYVATSPLINGVTGRYFEDCNPVIPGFQMENAEMAQRLWTVSENLTRPTSMRQRLVNKVRRNR